MTSLIWSCIVLWFNQLLSHAHLRLKRPVLALQRGIGPAHSRKTGPSGRFAAQCWRRWARPVTWTPARPFRRDKYRPSRPGFASWTRAMAATKPPTGATHR